MEFIESICCIDGEAKLLARHQDRMSRTFREFFPNNNELELEQVIKDIPLVGKYKCRLVYGENDYAIDFETYNERNIKSLKVVEGGDLDYAFKYKDRETLSDLFDQKGATDDIIISRKGMVTDSFFANLALYDGITWYTPESPLLKGVMREELITSGVLKEKPIHFTDIQNYQKVSLINAMNELGAIEVAPKFII